MLCTVHPSLTCEKCLVNLANTANHNSLRAYFLLASSVTKCLTAGRASMNALAKVFQDLRGTCTPYCSKIEERAYRQATKLEAIYCSTTEAAKIIAMQHCLPKGVLLQTT